MAHMAWPLLLSLYSWVWPLYAMPHPASSRYRITASNLSSMYLCQWRSVWIVNQLQALNYQELSIVLVDHGCTELFLTSPSLSEPESASDDHMSSSDPESDGLMRDSESEGSSNKDSMCSSGSESSDSESSNDSDPPHIIHPTVLEPLFEGSSISVFDSHLLIYQFQLKHGLSNGGLEELLQLIKAHTPHTDGLLKSAYALK